MSAIITITTRTCNIALCNLCYTTARFFFNIFDAQIIWCTVCYMRQCTWRQKNMVFKMKPLYRKWRHQMRILLYDHISLLLKKHTYKFLLSSHWKCLCFTLLL